MTARRVLVVALLGLALAGAPAAAQQPAPDDAIYLDPADLADAPEVTAGASPSEVTLGTRFVLIITAAYDDGVTVTLPSKLDLGGAFEERPGQARRTTDKVRTDGKRVREWQIEVIAWELGELEIPPVPVAFVRAGTAGAVPTNAVPVRVVGALGDLADTAQPRGIAPPLPLWRRTWLWVGVLGGVLAALIALAFVLRMRARRRPVVAAPAARPSGVFRRPRLGGPAEEALLRLQEIDRSGMLARDRKVAYTEMVAVMQTFLGRQLGDDVEELTTGELREWLADASIATGTRLELSRWLDECDLVKFGGLRPPIEDGRAQLAAGRALVIAIASPASAGAPEPEEAARA